MFLRLFFSGFVHFKVDFRVFWSLKPALRAFRGDLRGRDALGVRGALRQDQVPEIGRARRGRERRVGVLCAASGSMVGHSYSFLDKGETILHYPNGWPAGSPRVYSFVEAYKQTS